MKLQALIAVSLIIGASIIASYFIIHSQTKLDIKNATAEESSSGTNAPTDSLTAKNMLDIIGPENNPETSINKATSSDNQIGNNLTETFADLLASRIVAKNQDGLLQKDGQPAIQAPNSEEGIKQLISTIEATSTSEGGQYHPKVIAANLQISSDTSKKAQIAYIDALKNISDAHFRNFNKTSNEVLNEMVANGDTRDASELAQIYADIGDAYLRIAIPKNWLEFHKTLLSQFYTSADTWHAIGNFKEDPLQAILMANVLGTLEKSSEGINVLLSRGISENNLALQ